jgi:hypothetical protein
LHLGASDCYGDDKICAVKGKLGGRVFLARFAGVWRGEEAPGEFLQIFALLLRMERGAWSEEQETRSKKREAWS